MGPKTLQSKKTEIVYTKGSRWIDRSIYCYVYKHVNHYIALTFIQYLYSSVTKMMVLTHMERQNMHTVHIRAPGRPSAGKLLQSELHHMLVQRPDTHSIRVYTTILIPT